MARSKQANELLEELREPLEKIADGFERIAQTLDRIDKRIDGGGGPNGYATPPPSDPFTRHMRRYLPFYAIAIAWALMLVLLPSVSDQGQRVTTTGPQGETEGLLDQQTTIEVGPGGPVVTTGPASAARQASGRTVVRTQEQSLDVVQSLIGKGVTKNGVNCGPGVRQLPYSEYAAPCVGKFEGDNGGATFRGVTANEIKIVQRDYPDSANQQAVDAFLGTAGIAPRGIEDQAMAYLIPYLNKQFETYGRTIKFEKYVNNAANGTDELQGRGRTEACNDAVHIAKTMEAFTTGFTAGSEQFSDCAVGHQLGHFSSAAYYAETYYKRWRPYNWHRVTNCERIARQVAEYVGKRLANKNAQWAGDPLYRNRTRKIGVYVPDNEGYQLCVRMSRQILVNEYGFSDEQLRNDTFIYTLDVSRFADMAYQGVLHFKTRDVTTVILACDPYSMVLLTQAAKQQQYRPEWFLIGVAGTDLDQFGNLADQDVVRGSLFGMSQLGGTDLIYANDGEMRRTMRDAGVPQNLINQNATGRYWELLHIYSAIQLAGPELNYPTMARGLQSIYPTSGLGKAPVGRWSFADSHTAIIDSKEIYWGFDGSKWTYLTTHGGKRFTDGEWPRENPPVYPAA